MKRLPKKLVAVPFLLISTASIAGTSTHVYPETPAFNANLPIIKTTHGSDHLKANRLNPYPVCNALEDRRTVVYKVTDSWLPVGTISAYNNTNSDLPLTQETSRTQTISISVEGERSSSLDMEAGVEGSQKLGKSGSIGASASIALSLAQSIGGKASYSLSWKVGQKIGPYSVPAGYTGEATYGFRAVRMTGTQQFCKSNGTWGNATFWRAFVPVKSEVRVNLYQNLADSFDKGQPINTPINLVPTLGSVNTQPPAVTPDFDLKPSLTVSGAKSAGFSGFVALRVENVGKKNYRVKPYQGKEYDASFLVRVHTEDGPLGVDRFINPRSMKGAHVEDLGFDEEASVRSFLVTLSNPVYKGEKDTLAVFYFGDGNTKQGRIINYVTVDQVGRIEGDESFYNDRGFDSRFDAENDFGRQIKGLY